MFNPRSGRRVSCGARDHPGAFDPAGLQAHQEGLAQQIVTRHAGCASSAGMSRTVIEAGDFAIATK